MGAHVRVKVPAGEATVAGKMRTMKGSCRVTCHRGLSGGRPQTGEAGCKHVIAAGSSGRTPFAQLLPCPAVLIATPGWRCRGVASNAQVGDSSHPARARPMLPEPTFLLLRIITPEAGNHPAAEMLNHDVPRTPAGLLLPPAGVGGCRACTAQAERCHQRWGPPASLGA